jgi:hypothetical protein
MKLLLLCLILTGCADLTGVEPVNHQSVCFISTDSTHVTKVACTGPVKVQVR